MEKVVAPSDNVEVFRTAGGPTGQSAAPYPWMRVGCKLLRCRASKDFVGVRPRKPGQRGAYPSGRRSEQEVRQKLCFSCVIIR
jgi:hypothetical protein